MENNISFSAQTDSESDWDEVIEALNSLVRKFGPGLKFASVSSVAIDDTDVEHELVVDSKMGDYTIFKAMGAMQEVGIEYYQIMAAMEQFEKIGLVIREKVED